MKYKPDWEEAKARYCAWWEGETLDRCAIAVSAPVDGAPYPPPPACPDTPMERWTNLDYVWEINDYNMRYSYYAAEAYPMWVSGYPGHTSIPTFLGCNIDLDFRTGWWHPFITGDSLEPVLDLRIDPENFWWKFNHDVLSHGAAESVGKCIPSLGAIGGSGDTLAALRGTDRLLLDLVDRPEEVRAAEEHLMDIWIEVYDYCYQIVKKASEGGSTCWFPLWAPGKFYAAQNDFAYMISPKMFIDIFLPAIERQLEYLDYAIYHVDGEGNFAHVPVLCELPNLQALQILPGEGKPSPLHYMDTLKYVQKSGKNLHITIPAGQVETALKELSSKGLFIETWCPSEADARDLVKNVYKWSHI